MKKKKGFTLVELLAVIVILAVILIIAVPQIQSVIKSAKLGSIESTAKLIASSAESRYESKKALGHEVGDLKCTDVASLSNDYDKCKITFDDNGVATVIVNGKKDGKFNNLACQGTKDNMSCTEGEISTARKCTTTDTLVDNLKFVDGQYTYTYSGNDDGWSVVLTDKSSTDPVTTELCGTINDKPIVSMKEMFYHSAATSIDVSSFDTSNVTNMSGMFYGTTGAGIPQSLDSANAINVPQVYSGSQVLEIKGLENFDTSNVTDMSTMFQESKATTLNLSNFNTSNVTNMSRMFKNSAATEIKGLENFDTSNVTNMYDMFEGTKVTTLDLSNFDTSKVTNMQSMFLFSTATTLDVSSFDTSNVTDMSDMFLNNAATEIKGLENFDTSKVTNMRFMFENSGATTLNLSSFDTSKVTNMERMFSGSAATALDLSSFDTSNVTTMSMMFWNSTATTGYARTQEDADRFNASDYRPSALAFVVKS